MGELPPSCSTPQGPGVPRASRPGFLRVDSSGTSSAPLSRSVSFPFLASSSLHFTHLLSLGAFPPPSRSPFPSPSFPFLASSSLQFSPRSDTASSTDLSALVHSCFPPLLPRSFPFLASGSRRFFHFVPHTASRFVLLPLPRVSPRDSTLPRFVFSPLPVRYTFSSASSSVSSSFLPLPSPSFRPVLSSSLHSCPLRFSRRLLAHMAFRLFSRSPSLRPDPGFCRRSFAAQFLWPAGRAEAPPHHSREAASLTGRGGIHKPFVNKAAVHRKRWSRMLISTGFHAPLRRLKRSINWLLRSLSSVPSTIPLRRLERNASSIRRILPLESPRAMLPSVDWRCLMR